MKLTINRNELLTPLQQVIGAVEKRQTMPALANVLMNADENGFSLTATDLEITLRASVAYPIENSGKVTVPARKLLDICKALPDDSEITLDVKEGKALITAGRSRFNLICLDADEFPVLEDISSTKTFVIKQSLLKSLLDKTSFAMANQDVRFYLNGLMLEVGKNILRCVATDGHRLSLSESETDIDTESSQQIIIPRKGVIELQRLLEDSDESINVQISTNHVRAYTDTLEFTSKLIDGRFPDYKRVLPEQTENRLVADKLSLKVALNRASILSNEKYRGIRLELANNLLCIQAHNSEQEEAKDELEVEYQGDNLEVGFNVQYLLDVLNVIQGSLVELDLKDGNSSALLTDPESSDAKYVIMPMRI